MAMENMVREGEKWKKAGTRRISWADANLWPILDVLTPDQSTSWAVEKSQDDVSDIMWGKSVQDTDWVWTAPNPNLSWFETFDKEFARDNNCQP